MKDDWDDFNLDDAAPAPSEAPKPTPEVTPAPAPKAVPKSVAERPARTSVERVDSAVSSAKRLIQDGAASVQKTVVGVSEAGKPLASKLVNAAVKKASVPKPVPVPEAVQEVQEEQEAVEQKPVVKVPDNNQFKQPGISQVAEVDMAQTLAAAGERKAWLGANNHNIPFLPIMALGVVAVAIAVFVWPGPGNTKKIQDARIEAQATGSPPPPPPSQLGPTAPVVNPALAPVATPPVAPAPGVEASAPAPAPAAPAPVTAPVPGQPLLPTPPGTATPANAVPVATAPVAVTAATTTTPAATTPPADLLKDLKLPPPPPPVEDMPSKPTKSAGVPSPGYGSSTGSSGSSGSYGSSASQNRPKQAYKAPADNWDARRREAERFLNQSRGY